MKREHRSDDKHSSTICQALAEDTSSARNLFDFWHVLYVVRFLSKYIRFTGQQLATKQDET